MPDVSALMAVEQSWLLLTGHCAQRCQKPSCSPACTQLSASECVISRVHGAGFLSLPGSSVQCWDPPGHGDCWLEVKVPLAFLGGQATKETSDIRCDSPFAL